MGGNIFALRRKRPCEADACSALRHQSPAAHDDRTRWAGIRSECGLPITLVRGPGEEEVRPVGLRQDAAVEVTESCAKIASLRVDSSLWQDFFNLLPLASGCYNSDAWSGGHEDDRKTHAMRFCKTFILFIQAR